MTTARDVMHHGLITCRPETHIREMAEALVSSRIHALVVTDPDGEPLGIVADSDLLAGEWLAEDDESLAAMRGITAGELMTAPVVMIGADDSVEEAVEALRREHVSRLVVTDDARPVGIVSISDLVAQVARQPAKRQVVADVMSHGFLVCREGTPVTAAARAMHERRSRSIVVIDVDGNAVGVVTGRDLLPVLVGSVEDAAVDSLMHAPLTIAPEASLREAADRMIRKEVHRLLVVAPGETTPSGQISAADIVAEMAGPGLAWRD
jgi:predicted transcriptional regulator